MLAIQSLGPLSTRGLFEIGGCACLCSSSTARLLSVRNQRWLLGVGLVLSLRSPVVEVVDYVGDICDFLLATGHGVKLGICLLLV